MDLTLPNTLKRLFVTEVYCVDLAQSPALDAIITQLDDTCRAMARDDRAGQAWSQQNRYVGYTSYGTVRDLAQAAPVFGDLRTVIDAHVATYARQLELDMGGRTLKMSEAWVNMLDPMGGHSGHFHPHCAVSGTFYVATPPGSGGLLFEDPRLPLMMHAPRRSARARPDRQIQASVMPTRGTLLLWESWLRHEVPVNMGNEPRISISFNYA